MPTYEYFCEKCDREFEREQRISDPPLKTCPECRSRKITKLISRTSFVLKGGGWYSDLYSSSSGKSEGSGASADASSTSDSGGESKDSGKSEKSDKSEKTSSKSDKSGKSGKATKSSGKKTAA
jgi:putative FmdB family regulatory protein